MKRKVIFMAACVVAMFVVAACGGDGESKWKDLTSGTWELTSIKMGDKWQDVGDRMYASLTFEDDSTYTGKGAFGNGKGTYKLVEDTLFTYVKGKEYMRYEIKSIDNNSAELEAEYYGEKMSIKVKKVK